MAGIPENAQNIYQFLTGHGYTANAAAGILGNIEQESGGNPSAGSNPPGSGLIQQLGYPTGTSLLAAENDILSYDNQQNASGLASIATLNAEPSASAAALYYSQAFERPLASAANNTNRTQSAALVAQAAASGNWSQGGGGAGTPTGGLQTDAATGIPLPFPFDLIPGLGSSSDPLATTANSIGSLIENAFLKAFGVSSMKDAVERLGLILLGVALVLVGIHVFATGSGGRNVPQEIDIIQQGQNRVRSSGGSRSSGSSRSAGAIKTTEKRSAIRTGAGEAVEAAAVALCHIG